MDTFQHVLEPELVKLARARAMQFREYREVNLRACLNDIYEGYYPEEDV